MSFKSLTCIALLAIGSTFLQSCQTVKAVKMIQATEAEYVDYKSGAKQMRFVPMVHVSTKEFYADVERLVKEAKKDGYVLFYEYVDFDKATETEQRKLRKLVGFIPSPEGYDEMLGGLDKERYATQENEQFLNQVNEKDFNVDVSPQDILKEYERRYGELTLTEEDLNTPVRERMKPSEPKKQTMAVVIDYRNDYLSKAIQESKYNKIIVLYGAKHEKGLIKDLKALDKSWGKDK